MTRSVAGLCAQYIAIMGSQNNPEFNKLIVTRSNSRPSDKLFPPFAFSAPTGII